MKCGCYIQDNTFNPRDPSHIEYCAVHATAIDMHAALLALLNCRGLEAHGSSSDPGFCDDCRLRAHRAYLRGCGYSEEDASDIALACIASDKIAKGDEP